MSNFQKGRKIRKSVGSLDTMFVSEQINIQPTQAWKQSADNGGGSTWDLVLPQLVVLVGLLHRLDGGVVDLAQPLQSRWKNREVLKRETERERETGAGRETQRHPHQHSLWLFPQSQAAASHRCEFGLWGWRWNPLRLQKKTKKRTWSTSWVGSRPLPLVEQWKTMELDSTAGAKKPKESPRCFSSQKLIKLLMKGSHTCSIMMLCGEYCCSCFRVGLHKLHHRIRECRHDMTMMDD